MSLDMFGTTDADDPVLRAKARCLETDCDVRVAFNTLKECNERVTRKIKFTAENCHEEMMDLMEAVDHCAADKGFSKLR